MSLKDLNHSQQIKENHNIMEPRSIGQKAQNSGFRTQNTWKEIKVTTQNTSRRWPHNPAITHLHSTWVTNSLHMDKKQIYRIGPPTAWTKLRKTQSPYIGHSPHTFHIIIQNPRKRMKKFIPGMRSSKQSLNNIHLFFILW